MNFIYQHIEIRKSFKKDISLYNFTDKMDFESLIFDIFYEQE